MVRWFESIPAHVERIISAEEIRNHRLYCRIRFRVHRLAHQYANYTIRSPDGSQVMDVVTYRPWWGRTWTCWLRPAPDALWEKHTPGGFADRMNEIISRGGEHSEDS